MDPLGTNKILGAVLTAGLVFMGIRMLPEIFMHNEAPDVPAYIVGELEAGAQEEEVELPFPQAEWVAAMDPERGARVFRNCTSCHTSDSSGANGTGPGLWNVVGATKGVHPGFAYSEAMSDTGTSWTYEALDGFLENPKRYLPGTKMNFIGIRKESDRAAVIEYLRLAHDNPPPQPEPAAAMVELTEDAEDAAIPADGQQNQDPTVDYSETDGDNISDEGIDSVIDQPSLQEDGPDTLDEEVEETQEALQDEAADTVVPDDAPEETQQPN
ncbi:cytochrome c family protein [uncultured Algimonas sp.]|uniref:c-type cytochrome n=1 Tax=uncultured Algimonas sp. TaxID=1547920 RepID=UPI002604A366|nr:cytochrome c family protein [uncultured Algimonas sp.]